jgi:hypothetical protein
MAFNKRFEPGLGYVGSYQVSGHPHITGSTSLAASTEEKFVFPMVTKSLTIINNNGQDFYVHFVSGSSGAVVAGLHYIPLTSAGQTVTIDVKCRELYCTAPSGGSARSLTIYAELTNILPDQMHALTGSGHTD